MHETALEHVRKEVGGGREHDIMEMFVKNKMMWVEPSQCGACKVFGTDKHPQLIMP